jgi:lysophospholipase L1-like esterase
MTSTAATMHPGPPAPGRVLVALGDSAATRLPPGSDFRSSWTQQFYRSSRGPDGTLYDFTTPGATVANALDVQLPPVRDTRADLAAVWVNTTDLLEGLAPATYGQRLGQLVAALRARGMTVLLANAPPIQLFPTYPACVNSPPVCGVGVPVPSPSAMAAQVGAYDATIASIAQADGARLVDLNTVMTRALSRSAGSALVTNGVNLTAAGADLVAQAFAAQVPRW